MGIGEVFSTAFDKLNKKRILLLPTIISFSFSTILLVLLMFMTGSYGFFGEVKDQYASYSLVESSFITANLTSNNTNTSLQALSMLFGGTKHREGFISYMNSTGFDFTKKVVELMTPYNIVLTVIFFLVIILVSYYFLCATYAFIGLDARNKKITIKSGIEETNRLFGRFALLQFQQAGLFLLAILLVMLAILPLIVTFYINIIFGVIMTFALVISSFILIILISFRLFYSTPIIFIEDLSAWESIKKSNEMAKNNKMNIFIVSLILLATSIVVSQVTSPLNGYFIQSLFWKNAFAIIPLIILFVILAVATSIGRVFSNLFLFHAYLDFKKNRNKK